MEDLCSYKCPFMEKYTFINLYLPNQDQIKIVTLMLTDLMEKAEGVTLVGGDFILFLTKIGILPYLGCFKLLVKLINLKIIWININ